VKRTFFFILVASLWLAVAANQEAQAQDRPASPRGEASTQIGGAYMDGSYTGGKWIVVDYSRPILRGRTNIWGSGSEYGTALLGGAPVWRAGANKSTRFKTETDLIIGGEALPAGEYSLFIDLKEGAWTLIVSDHKAKMGSRTDDEGIWGSYSYTPEMDVLRTELKLESGSTSVDQLTFVFTDMSQEGGTLALMWDHVVASVPFSIDR